MVVNLLIEKGMGESLIYFDGLPGCFFRTASSENILPQASEVFLQYLVWTAEKDIMLDIDPAASLQIAEEIPLLSDQSPPIFEADRRPPGAEDIIVALRVSVQLRVEMVKIFESVPAAWRLMAPAKSMSMVDHLRHVVKEEMNMLQLLGDPNRRGDIALPTDPVMAITASALYTNKVLTNFPPIKRLQVFYRDNELWTIGKILRRMTAHLWEHYGQMAALIHR